MHLLLGVYDVIFKSSTGGAGYAENLAKRACYFMTSDDCKGRENLIHWKKVYGRARYGDSCDQRDRAVETGASQAPGPGAGAPEPGDDGAASV